MPSSTEWLISVLEGIEHATVGSYPYLLGSRMYNAYFITISSKGDTYIMIIKVINDNNVLYFQDLNFHHQLLTSIFLV